MEADYIVVGGGSAGSTVAARLARAGRRVLLLEAGPPDRGLLRGFLLDMPLGYGTSFYNPAVNWMYWTEPEPALGGRKLYVPRGRVLGGSSSINAMVWIRGQREDYADWAAAAGPAWGWESVAPAFAALEAEIRPSSMAAGAHPLCGAFLDAARAEGWPVNPDFNGASQEGAGFYPVNIRDGRRRSASAVFLRPAPQGLAIETGARVTRILLEQGRATGVAFVRGGMRREARARAEVILAAGAIGTPQLLMLSGIGPGAALHALGIEVLRDLPAIGRNLADHAAWDIYYRAAVPTLNEALRPLAGKLRAGLRYLLVRTGPLAWSMNHAGGFVRGPGAARPNLQLYFCPSSYDRAPPMTRRMLSPDPFPGFSLSVSNCRPRSRGEVALASADPMAAPRIRPNLLADPADLAEMVAGARLLRRLAAQPALRAVTAAETKPGPGVAADAELEADIRARAYSIFHPCGTVAMGTEAAAALDPALRVRGVGGLRVIDASAFPAIPSGNINAAAMMVGWRGAELVLAGTG